MTSRETPREGAEQITKELLAAALGAGAVKPHQALDARDTGQWIGDVYRELLAKVISGPAEAPAGRSTRP